MSFDRTNQITTRVDLSFDGFVARAEGVKVILADGSEALDLCGNIGCQNGFGWNPPYMQGHLMHTSAYDDLMETLVETFGFPHAFLATSGGRANDFALKLAASREEFHKPWIKHVVVSFTNGFHGRTVFTSALSGTDALFAPECFLKIPFYKQNDPHSTSHSLRALQDIFWRYGGRIYCFFVELLQGEGGFNEAPRDFFVPLFELCKETGVPVVIDEVQTSCRTGEPLLADRMNLLSYADIVTIGKFIPTAAVLFRKEYSVVTAGVNETFAGTEEALRQAAFILRRLKKEGHWGKDGLICKLENKLLFHFAALAKGYPAVVRSFVVRGAMAALALAGFERKERAVEFLRILKDERGILATSCGRGPYKVRFYIPLNISDDDLSYMLSNLEAVIASWTP